MFGLLGTLGASIAGGNALGSDKWGSLGAGLLNSGGDLLGMGLSKVMGFGHGGSAADAANAQIDAMGKLQEKSLLNDLKYQEAKNLASQTNSLGMTGQAAAIDAQRAMDMNGPTSDAIAASNNMNAQAQSGISGAATQSNIAKISGQQQTGSMMDQARGMSGNPAAAMAMMSKIGQQAGQNNLAALAAGNDAINKANSTAMGAAAQGGSLLDESRKTNFATNIAPHLTKTDASLNTANATIGGGAAAVTGSAGGNDHLITNPLENMASMYQGDASAKQAYNQAYGMFLGMKEASKYQPGIGETKPEEAASPGYIPSTYQQPPGTTWEYPLMQNSYPPSQLAGTNPPWGQPLLMPQPMQGYGLLSYGR